MFNCYHRRFFYLILCAFLLFLYFASVIFPQTNILSSHIYYYLFYPEESISCYRIKADSLPDIDTIKPKKGKSIFFHETSCNSYIAGKIVITSRQACAVESAAKMNPSFDIYLLFSSAGVFNFENTQSDKYLQALLNYTNVKIMHLDYEKYTKDTLVEELYKSGQIDYSNYPRSHASDVLRYLTLWKYGGIYLDLDVVVTKSLENLPPNYAGAESDKNVAAGVLSFSPNGIGHYHAKSCLNDLRHHFKGNDWGNNGPGVITRLLKNICGTEKAKDMQKRDCQGFTVYPPEMFYPVPWWNWTMYFEERYLNEVLNLSERSNVIHVWNKHSTNTLISVDSKIPYAVIAKQYCPKVYAACDAYF